MNTVRSKLNAIQNLGLADRCFRFILGSLLIGVAFFDLYYGSIASWHTYVMLLAIYPIMSAILGWDPFYAAAGSKSCDTSGTNRCGTFPYEVQAALHLLPEQQTEEQMHIAQIKKTAPWHKG